MAVEDSEVTSGDISSEVVKASIGVLHVGPILAVGILVHCVFLAARCVLYIHPSLLNEGRRRRIPAKSVVV